jgi:hypothetical protein
VTSHPAQRKRDTSVSRRSPSDDSKGKRTSRHSAEETSVSVTAQLLPTQVHSNNTQNRVSREWPSGSGACRRIRKSPSAGVMVANTFCARKTLRLGPLGDLLPMRRAPPVPAFFFHGLCLSTVLTRVPSRFVPGEDWRAGLVGRPEPIPLTSLNCALERHYSVRRRVLTVPLEVGTGFPQSGQSFGGRTSGLRRSENRRLGWAGKFDGRFGRVGNGSTTS